MRELIRIIGLAFFASAFVFAFHLTAQTYGHARYTQGHEAGARSYHEFLNKQLQKQLLSKEVTVSIIMMEPDILQMFH